MVKQMAHELVYYYDSHPTPEDLMTETEPHAALVNYLNAVLTWLFEGQVCSVYDNLGFYQTDYYKERPLGPDLAVIKGVNLHGIDHWRVGTTGPAPHVVFEIASKETWKKDVEKKPARYAQMGVAEYFFYDPNTPPLSPKTAQRLKGWHLSQGVREMVAGPNGWLWSSQLESFLGADRAYLRLYDRSGQMRLTRADAENRRAEMEAQARRDADRRAETEAQARRDADKRAEMEAEAKRAQAKRADALAEKLRSLGIDPNSI